MRKQLLRSQENQRSVSAYIENSIDVDQACLVALKVAIDQKALDVSFLDIRQVSQISDYFLIMSGTSDRHVKGIADKIKLELSRSAYKPSQIDGYDNADWIILDYLDFMVHIFYEPARQFYNFDELWQKAEERELPTELAEASRKLRTGYINKR